MSLGKVIRKYRKIKNLTQEEINEMICEADLKLKEQSYEEAFQWAKKTLEQYPNCEQLFLNIAIMLDAHRIMKGISQHAEYEDYICSLYIRGLNSLDETIRIRAADALVGFYMRKSQYDKAEQYLEYFSVQNPERKRKQAQIYAETGRIREAYKAYEELLFSDFQRSSMELHGMYMLAMQNNDKKRAHWLVDKQKELARCFEMGKYYEISSKLDIATVEKDADSVIAVMEEMLSSVEQIGDFRKSMLYEHLDFKGVTEDFISNVKENLKKCFRDEESYGFLRDNKRWQNLVNQ